MKPERPSPKQSIPKGAVRVFKGVIFDVYQWPQKLYDGKTVTFEQLRRPDSVNIIPITQDGKIILGKQEQPGMESFIGTLSGRVDAGETPEQAAARELAEEGGLQAKQLVLWDAVQIAEKLDWAVWTFIAKGCQQIERHLDGGEKITLIEVTFDEYVDLVAQDNYRDSDIALLLLKLAQRKGELEKVKQDWLS
jgi:ADP-ribose pyrophosphatase